MQAPLESTLGTQILIILCSIFERLFFAYIFRSTLNQNMVLLPPFALEFPALSTCFIVRSSIHLGFFFWIFRAFPISCWSLYEGIDLLMVWRLVLWTAVLNHVAVMFIMVTFPFRNLSSVNV